MDVPPRRDPAGEQADEQFFHQALEGSHGPQEYAFVEQADVVTADMPGKQ